MTLNHSNPTKPRRDRQGHETWARAPYNFVPLPEKMVLARPPLDHDAYHDAEGFTGCIECTLETCSPTYVRGMFSVEQFNRLGDKKSDQLDPTEKSERAPFFAISDEKVEGHSVPVIPGSSLRGMIRSLVEIIGYGRMRWVGKEPTFTFRAVAASRDDPLRDPYRDVIGAFGANVRAGYLRREGDDWFVEPALTPQSQGWPEKSAYLKVKERQIDNRAIPGFLRFNSEGYRPQLHDVTFDVGFGAGQSGRYVYITQIGDGKAGYKYKGVLVCSGNMLETGKSGQRSPRKGHALVLARDSRARPLKVRPQAVKDYLAGLTPFQHEDLSHDWDKRGDGCLKEGAPVFYVSEGNEVVYFGHSPNFRIPMRLFGDNSKRAAIPPDFIPEKLLSDPRPDLADAIFGWVEEEGTGPCTDPKPGDLPRGRAGRVYFEDARFIEATNGVWLRPEPITPHTLGSPKPTTFQHYLVQDQRAGHDPDRKETLAHYGTDRDETRLRGHKLYWHKGANPDIEATAKERQHDNQLTRIMPLRVGVSFSFKIRFENLRTEELGALWWALALPGEPGKTYRHKLGMGKPLGMGAVAIAPRLVLNHRGQERYGALFEGASWKTGEKEADPLAHVQAFERHVLSEIGAATEKSLAEVERIRMLLTMLEWREGTEAWNDATRYMEIEHGEDKINEYKERPALPDPIAVATGRRLPQTDAHTRPQPTPSSIHGKDQPPTGVSNQSKVDTIATLKGIVKRWDDQKGYGFITQSDGSEIFVHHSNILGAGRKTLRQGQSVTYRVGPGMKGPEAKEVRPQ